MKNNKRLLSVILPLLLIGVFLTYKCIFIKKKSALYQERKMILINKTDDYYKILMKKSEDIFNSANNIADGIKHDMPDDVLENICNLRKLKKTDLTEYYKIKKHLVINIKKSAIRKLPSSGFNHDEYYRENIIHYISAENDMIFVFNKARTDTYDMCLTEIWNLQGNDWCMNDLKNEFSRESQTICCLENRKIEMECFFTGQYQVYHQAARRKSGNLPGSAFSRMNNARSA